MAQDCHKALEPEARWRKLWPGGVLGFAMGGFFDGILLHQILQWHHLFSSVNSGWLRNLRDQILFDGVFHLLMYALLLAGFAGLWRQLGSGANRPAQHVGAAFFIGFGLWHIVDAVLSHWVLGIHRIRPDSDNPLFWDMVFLGLGLACVAGGWHFSKKPSLDRPRFTALVIAALTLAGGIAALIPWEKGGPITVVFRSDVDPVDVIAAAHAVDADLLWSSAQGDVWAFDVPDRRKAMQLYQHGAWYVSGSYGGAGCFTPPQDDRKLQAGI